MIRRRNPGFHFSPQVTTSLLLGLGWEYARSQFRALRLLAYGHPAAFRFIGLRTKIVMGKQLRLGRWVRIGESCTLSAFGQEALQIGDRSGIGAFSRLIVSSDYSQPGKGIRIGERVGIGEYAYLGGAGGLEIGDDCIIGQYFSCHPQNHLFDHAEQAIRLQGVTQKGINIGSNCWIGSKVTVLDGVSIGDGCVVAAGAVVTKNFPAGAVLAGVPARMIKSRFPMVSPSKMAQ